ncbi:MAG: restriction endonuclease subunit S [Ruminococcus sp.]|nr:restriction endonuclease subunit S [Ruminococcus sp.]MCM1381939.1 restriction endonuclease subunit S [Muribaculaceae bacterium]MCM1479787.1 restriction endonuclease subunit S [Muribaculaceae bacterium]
METFENLVDMVSVFPNKKIKQKEYLKSGILPIVDQGQKLIGGYSDDMSKVIVCDLPVIIFGDHTRCVKYINFEFGAGADGIKVIKPKANVLPKYLYYGMKYLTFRMIDKGYARHYQHIRKMQLTVPSKVEQSHIVSRIEELFSELDKAVETLQTTKKQLVVYRQAVLKEAFWGSENKHGKVVKISDLQKLKQEQLPQKQTRNTTEVLFHGLQVRL